MQRYFLHFKQKVKPFHVLVTFYTLIIISGLIYKIFNQ